MSILKLIATFLKKQGGPVLITWIGLMLLTVIGFQAFAAQPLTGRQMNGMALTHAAIGSIGVAAWRLFRRRASDRPAGTDEGGPR